MRFCDNCGEELEDDMEYCPSCGENVHNAAPSKKEEKTTSSPPFFDPKDIMQNRFSAAITYFGPMFIWGLANRRSKFVRFHASQSLSILLALLIYTAFFVVGSVLLASYGYFDTLIWFAVFGGMCYIVISVLYIIGIVRAASGSQWHIPFFGKNRDR